MDAKIPAMVFFRFKEEITYTCKMIALKMIAEEKSVQQTKFFEITAILLPIILIVIFVNLYGLKIPYQDEWEIVGAIEKMHNHSLTTADLWAQHNEHRIFFPRIIMLFSAKFSKWNISLELYANIIIATAILILLLSILKSTVENTPRLLKLFTALIAFSMVQNENWAWGWQMQIFLSAFGTILAVWAANKWQGQIKGLLTVIIGAVISSYSFNSGLGTFIAVLLIFLLQNKWKLIHILILIVVFAGAISLYYYNYRKPVLHPSLLFFADHPQLYLKYVFTCMGSSLAWNYSSAQLIAEISIIIIVCAIIFLWKMDRSKISMLAPWFALALYACITALAIGIGRSGLNSRQSMASRYTTITLYLPLCAIILFPYAAGLITHLNKFNKTVFMLILLSTYMLSYCKGIIEMRTRYMDTRKAAAYLSDIKAAKDEELNILFYDPNVLRTRVQILFDMGIKF
ncbi:MAG: hypothetical protein ABFD79_11660 [Phycisphaerales bacterium]